MPKEVQLGVATWVLGWTVGFCMDVGEHKGLSMSRVCGVEYSQDRDVMRGFRALGKSWA